MLPAKLILFRFSINKTIMKQLLILLLAVACSTSTFAQASSQASHKRAQKATPTTIYRCPMNLDVTSSKPGKCPKCGMQLVKARSTVYTCPMDAEVTSNKPGKCAKCGMNLEVRKDETTNSRTNL